MCSLIVLAMVCQTLGVKPSPGRYFVRFRIDRPFSLSQLFSLTMESSGMSARMDMFSLRDISARIYTGFNTIGYLVPSPSCIVRRNGALDAGE